MARRDAQAELAIPAPKLELSASLGEPKIWVKRFMLWQDVSKPPTRTEVFYRGLNIVWSPAASDANAFAVGHAAGKTLFCRLLRYCLGESAFADKEDSEVIVERFPQGAVGAEVRVNGESWTVRRNFTGQGDFAIKGTPARGENGDQVPFEQFVLILQAAAIGPDILPLLPETVGTTPWEYLLAWLSRDQECRMDELTHWRHSESSSYSPVRHSSHAERTQLVQAVLQLFSSEANKTRIAVDAATAHVKNAADARERVENRFQVLEAEVSDILEIPTGDIWKKENEFFNEDLDVLRAQKNNLLKHVDAKIRALGVIKTTPEHIAAGERVTEIDLELQDVQNRLDINEAELKTAQAAVGLLEQNEANAKAEHRSAKLPLCPWDQTPLDVDASKFACPLVKFPDVDRARERAEQASEDLQEQVERRNHLQDQCGVDKKTRIKLKAARREAGKHLAQLDEEAAQRARPEVSLWGAKPLINSMFEAREALNQREQDEERAKDAARDAVHARDTVYERLSSKRLAHWFDVLVKLVISPSARAHVVLGALGPHPEFFWNGKRHSVALNSLRVVLFDLAAMLCAAEGKAHAPAFLMHDSPREGDLDAFLYSRIFDVMLQAGPDQETAAFQYILTTTTAPPEGPAHARIRMKLGSRTNERLFCADL